MPDRERLVVADTSPLLYLHRAGHLHLLRELYGGIVVPPAVVAELATGADLGHAVPPLAAFDWIRVLALPDRTLLPAMVDLGPGESEVIFLGLAHSGSLVLLDDRLARRIASLVGLAHSGTLGILLKARNAGLLDSVRPILQSLRSHGMRIHADLEEQVLQLAGESHR